MTIVIPMAGRGRRFVDAGFQLPKMLIKAHGKTLLQWSVDSLPLSMCDSLVFVGLEEHEREFGLSQRIQEWYGGSNRLRFVFLPAVTGGQAETVLTAQADIDPDNALLIFNTDTTFISTSLPRALWTGANDGVLGAFASTEPRFSFAALDAGGLVTRVAEKKAISNHALTGLYHFRRGGDFIETAREMIEMGAKVKGEYYVAPLYNDLINQGKRFVIDECQSVNILGTPEELREFLASQPSL